MEVTGGLVYTKSLWTVISGTHLRATSEVVKHELDKCAELFSKGLTSFRPQNDESVKKLKCKFAPQAYKFVISLGKFLGIDALQAWDLLSNYLLYEFQGAEVGLQAFLVSDEKTNMLMTDIWMFYHSERLFLLKCINLVLSYCDDPNHPYQATLLKFLSNFKSDEFSNSLFTQLDTVTNEPYPHRDIHGQLMTDQYQLRWQNYNLREQIEVLHNMIVYVDMKCVNPSHLSKIIKLCIDSRFGKQEEYKVRNTALAKYYSELIGYLQNVLILQHMNSVACSVLTRKELTLNIDDLISILGDQKEHAPLIMSWTLIKSFESYKDTSSTIFEKLGDLAQNSGAFEYLRQLVSSDMFQDSNKLSSIVFKTVYDFVSLFTNNFEPEAFYHIKGLLNLVGPMLKHNIVVERFWTRDSGIRTLFRVLSERFPADYTCFIEALDSLAKHGPNHIDKLMQVLLNTHSYAEVLGNVLTAETMLACGPNEWQCTVSWRPLRYSNFTIPAGTKGHFIDEDLQLFNWQCDFVVFEAIYNEMRKIVEQISSLEHEVNVNTQENVIASLKFLRSFLSAGVELTKEAVGVVNFVLTIISKLKNVFCVSTVVLALCLDILVTLLPKFPEEILRRLRLLDVLPTIQMVPKNFIFIFDGEYFTPKTIGTIISREECVCGEYPLLTSYLTFIYKLIKSESNLEASVKNNINLILPGIVFILSDVYPNYQSWHFEDEKEYDIIAVSCMKIFHEILSVSGTNGNKSDVTTPLQLVQNLVLYSFLNMKAGKVLLKVVSAGEGFIQNKMEKKMNWVSGHGLSTIYLLQLSLSILNRVLMLKSHVHEKNILSALENDIYCSPKESLQVIPVIASYINNSFSPILPVLAVKVLRRFAMDMPKTLLACLGMEGDVLRELIFRRLNSRIDSNRLKVALLQLVSACVDTQPGMCDAFFNLPLDTGGSSASDDSQNIKQQKPEFLKREPVKDNTKGGCLVFVCAVLAKVQKDPDLVTNPLYGAAVDLICSLWLGENSAAVEYLRNKEHFWDLFCAPLFSKPQQYVYAFTQLFNIITLEIFHYGKNTHKDLLAAMEKFFNEKGSSFNNWAEFVSNTFINSNSDDDVNEHITIENSNVHTYVWDSVALTEDHKHPQQMEKQPPNVQLLISWKRFIITTMKLLPFKIGTEQKVVLTRSLMSALQNELQRMSLKPILLLVELYLVLITDWHKQFFDNREVVKDQIKLMLKSCAATYQPLPRRVREAVLALALRAIDCLQDQIQKDEIAAETMLQSITEMVLLELSDVGVPVQKTKLKCESDDDKSSDITLSLTQHLFPAKHLQDLPEVRGSMSGRLALALLHKLLKILLGNTMWLQSFKLAEIRSAVLRGLGRTLNQLHNKMNMFHFSVALNAINLVFFMIQNNIVDTALDSQLPDNLWLQLIPPKFENKHWLCTDWPLLYKPALEIITQHLQSRSFLFLENVITFVAMHDEYLVDAILSFRYSLDEKMLELSMLALNLVRTLSFYPNHWKLSHDASLSNIMFGVMTCLHMCVALLFNPVTLKALLERPDKKVEQKSLIGITDSDVSPQIIPIHNQILKLTFLCLTILQSYSPRLVYLLTECVRSPVASKPLVETNLDPPVFDHDALTSLTFGTLIALANLCTQALSKGVRAPSPRPAISSFRSGLGVGSLIVSMDKCLTSSVLEITVEMITSQGLVYLLGNSLSCTDKELLRRGLNTEMTFFIEFSKRSIREGICSYTLETTLQALKSYLATSMNLPILRKIPVDKSQLQQAKIRRFSMRDSYSPRSASSTPSKVPREYSSNVNSPGKGSNIHTGVSQTPPHGQSRVNGSKERTPTDTAQCDFHLPLCEDFVKLVAIVFSSIFDVFNTGFDMT
ncbi:hypothetical protein R5R35_014636 [Gryllus longicercus]|uniref:Nucleoporin Nup188 N-terminal subdomain III domain-containing protein n=1 Tax=Gryllus longicercus TaxID=2509291 RepID=A0AAN9VJP5_9ORTH